jgi:Porin subfamily
LYEHIWNPKWRTSFFGGYVNVDYGGAATNLINSSCGAASACPSVPPTAGAVVGTITAFTPLAGNSCSPDYSYFEVGTRTQWNPVAQLDIGLEVLYTKHNTAFQGPSNFVANGARPACINSAQLGCRIDDQDVWSAMFRWQRNFYP